MKLEFTPKQTLVLGSLLQAIGKGEPLTLRDAEDAVELSDSIINQIQNVYDEALAISVKYKLEKEQADREADKELFNKQRDEYFQSKRERDLRDLEL